MNAHIRFFVTISSLVLFLVACGQQQAPVAQASAPEVTVVTLKAQPVTLTRELPGRTNPLSSPRFDPR